MRQDRREFLVFAIPLSASIRSGLYHENDHNKDVIITDNIMTTGQKNDARLMFCQPSSCVHIAIIGLIERAVPLTASNLLLATGSHRFISRIMP